MPETVLADSRFDQQHITTHVLTDQRTYRRLYTTCWCPGRHPIQPERPGGTPGWRVAGAWSPAALTRVTPKLESATTTWRARRRAWLASRRRVASSCPGGSTAPRLASSGSALASSPAAGALHAVHLRLIHEGSAVAARTWPQAVPAVLRGCQQRCNRAFVTSPHLVTDALAAAHASKAHAHSLDKRYLKAAGAALFVGVAVGAEPAPPPLPGALGRCPAGARVQPRMLLPQPRFVLRACPGALTPQSTASPAPLIRTLHASTL